MECFVVGVPYPCECFDESVRGNDGGFVGAGEDRDLVDFFAIEQFGLGGFIDSEDHSISDGTDLCECFLH